MAFDRHTVFGAALVAVILAACIAGIAITGGPGEARREKEDRARLEAVSQTAIALACYFQAKGDIPEDLSIVEAEFSHATSEARQQDYCSRADIRKDPVSGKDFRLQRQDGSVTHICADFVTAGGDGKSGYIPFSAATSNVIPDLDAPRETAGEYCFELNLSGKLEY